ncbi:Copper chaperone CopZ [Pseudobutyrivibrio sp. YE44]|uniref:heavy-metal-associated domain-containing protein n=1 Tax=Pseudobutyrivibrio sp. YE44 TaxID=1520802 RepID=UPI0008912373|nr:cation transporter [Pseudobutyrivibrio sp. YE44]SDB55723.1 Copper chaperone CopZ [Pseudobutyrivibrio sp. YE44]
MTKTILKIEGMMCGMCEAHVNDAIRKALPDAKKVTSSHTKGESSFISEQIPDENKLVAAIGETGYSVQSISSEPYKKKFLGLF